MPYKKQKTASSCKKHIKRHNDRLGFKLFNRFQHAKHFRQHIHTYNIR